MAINRGHLIAPLAIGAAALSLAGTGAAFAATGRTPPNSATITTPHTHRGGREGRSPRSGRHQGPWGEGHRQAGDQWPASRDTTHDAARTDRARANER